MCCFRWIVWQKNGSRICYLCWRTQFRRSLLPQKHDDVTHAELSAEHASYVFYHVQDKERCLEAGPSQPLCLYLGYDFEDAATEARALAILKKHLDVEWDGDHRTRICVRPKAPCAQ